MLANPFQKIAGLYALMGGLAIIICMSSTHFFLVVLSKPYYLVSNDFPFYYFLQNISTKKIKACRFCGDGCFVSLSISHYDAIFSYRTNHPATPAAIDELSYNDLIREGAVRGINDPVVWMDYRKQRNITSHAYEEKMAQEVYETVLKFFKDAEDLLRKLQARNQ